MARSSLDQVYHLVCRLDYPDLLKICQGLSCPIFQQAVDFFIAQHDDDISFAFQTAIKEGRLPLLNELLRRGADPNEGENYPIIEASKRGYLDVVNWLLLDTRVDPSARGNEALMKASQFGHLDVVNRLLEDPRVDPGAQESEALFKAMRGGHDEITDRLLSDPRVDPSAQNNEALIMARKQRRWDVVYRLLLDPRVNPNVLSVNDIKTIITKATKHDRWDVVAQLAKYL